MAPEKVTLELRREGGEGGSHKERRGSRQKDQQVERLEWGVRLSQQRPERLVGRREQQ